MWFQLYYISCRYDCVRAALITNNSETKFSHPISDEFNTNVIMVTKCIMNMENETVRDLCENPNDPDTVATVVPVSDSVFNYRNRFCAYCNGVTTFIEWAAKLYCDANITSSNNLVSLVRRRKCNIFFIPPTNHTVIPCFQLREQIPGCNLTGRLTPGSLPVSFACGASIEGMQDVIYSNTFLCYICEVNQSITLEVYPFCYMDIAVPMQVEAPFVTNLPLEELFNTDDNADNCDPLTQFDDYKMVSET